MAHLNIDKIAAELKDKGFGVGLTPDKEILSIRHLETGLSMSIEIRNALTDGVYRTEDMLRATFFDVSVDINSSFAEVETEEEFISLVESVFAPEIKNPSYMSTPNLVHEYVGMKVADVRREAGETSTAEEHARLVAVVTELRNRAVLD